MRGIGETEFNLDVKPILQKVFQGRDEWKPLFNYEFKLKRILYPLEPYKTNKYFMPLLEAIVEAASSLGDKGCYFSENHMYQREYNHIYIALSELVNDLTVSSMDENLATEQLDIQFSTYFKIYSEQGKWGLFSSFEHFGLLGGVSEFMTVIESRIPDMENQTHEFLRDFRGDPTNVQGLSKARAPIRNMLEHIYGSSKAEQLLEETGWY